MIIKGKYNTAEVFTDNIDQAAISQLIELCNQEAFKDSIIKIMPDVHAGIGCTIGTTMTVHDKIVPNLVGVDIGCGMYTIELNEEDKNLDLDLVDKIIHEIPSGKNVWEDSRFNSFNFKELRCYDHLKELNWLERSMGTLGGGNHFIEIDKNDEGNLYLIIHSGSRNLGKQVAEYYQNLAISNLLGNNKLKEEKNKLINEFKENGREKDINNELKKLEKNFKKVKIKKELAYLTGKDMDDYLHDLDLCQNFAKMNRKIIANYILKGLGIKEFLYDFHTVHNYMDKYEKILRKGAISADKYETVLIPINMRDGCILAMGRGNNKWNRSAPHGAGRILSRSQAKEEINIEDFKKSMEGIYTTSVHEGTLDESPMVYKPIEDILKYINKTVTILELLSPIYNFKA